MEISEKGKDKKEDTDYHVETPVAPRGLGRLRLQVRMSEE